MTTHAPTSGSSELAPTRATLLERLRDLQDHGSWQEFFDTYWKLIYCAAVKSGLSDQEAEDVVQETVIGVARKMETFRYQPEACSFKGWLMHITRCRIIDHLRKRGARGQFVPLQAEAGTSDAGIQDAGIQIRDEAAELAFADVWEGEWEKNLMDAALERVRKAVNPEHYQIFYLSGIKNMPVRKIRELLHVSAAKVYVVRHRIARLVKKEVKELSRL
jgi:RNA polymerase sigma factor (sigma-70 family)